MPSTSSTIGVNGNTSASTETTSSPNHRFLTAAKIVAPFGTLPDDGFADDTGDDAREQSHAEGVHDERHHRAGGRCCRSS